MIEWKDRLLVIRESQIYPFKDLSVSLSYLAFLSFSHLPKDPIPRKPRFLSCLTVIRKSDHLKDSESAIEVTPELRILSAKFRTRRATSTVIEIILFRE